MSDSFSTPWIVAHQASLSMGFPRQEYWSGLPFPPQGIFPTQGLNSNPLQWQANSLPLSHQGSPMSLWFYFKERTRGSIYTFLSLLCSASAPLSWAPLPFLPGHTSRFPFFPKPVSLYSEICPCHSLLGGSLNWTCSLFQKNQKNVLEIYNNTSKTHAEHAPQLIYSFKQLKSCCPKLTETESRRDFLSMIWVVFKVWSYFSPLLLRWSNSDGFLNCHSL